MRNLKTAFLLLIVPLITACQIWNNQISDIDNVITKYEQTDFSKLKNLSVYFRSMGNPLYSSIYFVNQSTASCSLYSVEVNDFDKSIIEIKNDLVISSCGKDYLTHDQIEVALKEYFSLNLHLVIVDLDGNVLMNPFEANSSAVLLRLTKESNEKEVRKDYVYKHYKGRWYLKK